MGFVSGSATFRTFQLLNPSLEMEDVLQRLKKNLVKPLSYDDSREVATGWCHPMTGEENISASNVMVGDNSLLFALRIDEKKVPSMLFKLRLRAAFERYMKTLPEGDKKRIPKKMKDALKDQLRTELLARTLPTIKLVEVLWLFDRHQIWVGTSSQKSLGFFEKLFNETFALPILLLNSGVAALNFDSIMAGDYDELKTYSSFLPTSISEAPVPAKGTESETSSQEVYF